jgi:hypothetical protein
MDEAGVSECMINRVLDDITQVRASPSIALFSRFPSQTRSFLTVLTPGPGHDLIDQSSSLKIATKATPLLSQDHPEMGRRNTNQKPSYEALLSGLQVLEIPLPEIALPEIPLGLHIH